MNRIVIAAAVLAGVLGLAARAGAQPSPLLPGGAPFGSGGQFPSAIGAGVISGYGYSFPIRPGINPYFYGGYPLSTRGSTPYTIYPGGGAYGGVLGGFSPIPSQLPPGVVPPTTPYVAPQYTISWNPPAGAVGSGPGVVGAPAVGAPAVVGSPVVGAPVGTPVIVAPPPVVTTGRVGRRFRW